MQAVWCNRKRREARERISNYMAFIDELKKTLKAIGEQLT